ncbi:hypothetical protein [Saccharothrix saharensis]|uniref:hypothetical protein n=1 Tax=Saccharothrix saharensis TaxID=571190 RepID=UPI001FEC53C5|nr:hypothetical protein [Saccharothrix saharensis]
MRPFDQGGQVVLRCRRRRRNPAEARVEHADPIEPGGLLLESDTVIDHRSFRAVGLGERGVPGTPRLSQARQALDGFPVQGGPVRTESGLQPQLLRPLDEVEVLHVRALGQDELLLRLRQTPPCRPQRFDRVGAFGSDVLAAELVDVLQRHGGGGVRAGCGRGPLQMLLQCTGITEHAEHVRLPHARGRGERAAVQPQPPTGVRCTGEHDLGTDVPVQREVQGPAVHLAEQVLAELDTSSVGQFDDRGHRPRAAAPRSVPFGEPLFGGSRPASSPLPPAQRRVDRGVP